MSVEPRGRASLCAHHLARKEEPMKTKSKIKAGGYAIRGV
jgi:hypothetical protein